MTAPLAKWSLRARITTACAAGALGLSLTLALSTYTLANSYLLRQREQTAVRQTALNATAVDEQLSASTPPASALRRADRLAGNQAILYYQSRRYQTDPVINRDPVGPVLLGALSGATTTQERFSVGGVRRLVVGVRLPHSQAHYFEMFSLFELKRTMGTLRLSLLMTAFFTTIAGAALGRWASGRLLRPIGEAATAAAAMASGDLDTRIAKCADRDLQVLGSSFNHMADALQRRIERDARFASDVSHELRTPLTTLATALAVLQTRRADLPRPAQLATDLLSSEVGRFQQLVQDLLEMSRLDAGAADLHLEAVSFGDFLREATQAAGAGAIPVVAPLLADDVAVELDKRRIERSLANLVDNAHHHGGGVSAIIGECRGDTVRIAIEDRGPGVSPSDRQRVFERFARSSTAQQDAIEDGHLGVGLGLALVAEHVRLHRGRVWVEDNPGGGSRFVVELPLRHDSVGQPNCPACV